MWKRNNERWDVEDFCFLWIFMFGMRWTISAPLRLKVDREKRFHFKFVAMQAPYVGVGRKTQQQLIHFQILLFLLLLLLLLLLPITYKVSKGKWLKMHAKPPRRQVQFPGIGIVLFFPQPVGLVLRLTYFSVGLVVKVFLSFLSLLLLLLLSSSSSSFVFFLLLLLLLLLLHNLTFCFYRLGRLFRLFSSQIEASTGSFLARLYLFMAQVDNQETYPNW